MAAVLGTARVRIITNIVMKSIVCGTIANTNVRKGKRMERLTERDEFGNADIIGVDNEDLQINLDFAEFNKVTVALNKLAEYEDMEEQGKLLKLPCVVGDVVYRLYTVDDVVKVYEHRITTLTNIVNVMETGEIGKTVFLTKEAAESALRELTS